MVVCGCVVCWKYDSKTRKTPNDQFTLKGAKRVQADHAGTWWGGVGWNPVRGLLSRGDVGQDVQVQEYSFLQNLGLHIVLHTYIQYSKSITPSRIYYCWAQSVSCQCSKRSMFLFNGSSQNQIINHFFYFRSQSRAKKLRIRMDS